MIEIKDSVDEETFGSRFKKLRYRMGREYTLDKVARDLHVHPTTVWSWENKNKIPREKILIKVAEYFDVSIDYLFGLENKEQEKKTPSWDYARINEILSNPFTQTILGELNDYINQDMKEDLGEIITFIRFRKMEKLNRLSPLPQGI